MTGSLQIKNGKYYAVINTTDISGKRKQKWIFSGYEVRGNKKKAEAFLRDKIKEFELQANLVPSDILFSDYVLYWLEVAKVKVDTITYQGYKNIVDAHIVPYFISKSIKLKDLTRNDIQQYVNEKLENGKIRGKGGLSPKSIHTHMIIIQQTCKEAIKNNILLNNPCQYISLPKLQKHKAKFYSITELQDMFECLKNEELYPLIYFTVIFGLRRSEVLGLKWDSIDFERNIVTIKHTVVKFSSVVEKDTTKTNSSYRAYPLLPEVKKMIIKLKEEESKNKKLFGKSYIENDYIFKWADGHTYRPDYISSRFKQLLDKHNLRQIRFHDLRHSCASLLVANGFNIKDIQEWLGHSDIQTTANIYAHLDVERKNKIANSMVNSLSF